MFFISSFSFYQIYWLLQKNHSAFFDNTGDNQILDKIKSATYKKCNEYREQAFLLQTHFFGIKKPQGGVGH